MRTKVPFKYVWGREVDEYFNKIVDIARKKIASDDDYRGLIVGDTGTGKSHFDLHFVTAFMQEPDIRAFGLNEESYAQAVKWAYEARREGQPFVACVYDEANIYSTEVMKEFNREIMRLMGEIRGLNILHLWSMPNPGRIQQDFIDETFDFIVYIYTKDNDRPRMYAFFDRAAIDKLRRKEGSKTAKARLTLDLLRRVHKKYASFLGCFCEYQGPLREAYDKLKESKMGDRVADFYERFGADGFIQQDIARAEGVGHMTAHNWTKGAITEGVIIEGVDFSVNGAGTKRFTQEGFIKIRNYGRKKHKMPLIGEGGGEMEALKPPSLNKTREAGKTGAAE